MSYFVSSGRETLLSSVQFKVPLSQPGIQASRRSVCFTAAQPRLILAALLHLWGSKYLTIYHKIIVSLIVRSTYNSDLRRAKISLTNVAS